MTIVPKTKIRSTARGTFFDSLRLNPQLFQGQLLAL
ncbi:hypothetical protein HRbin26_00303 [bacterium HR26]|nr:hypothetical protein HRbin26_00303 [bacterium HR26]